MYKDNKGNEVSVKKYAWKVVYKDGSTLEQFDDQMTYHYLSEVDFDNVEYFIVYRFADGAVKYTTLVTDDVKVFKFHYDIKTVDMGGNAPDRSYRVDVFGLKHKGSKKAVYIHILPNDEVIVSPHDKVDLSKFIS